MNNDDFTSAVSLKNEKIFLIITRFSVYLYELGISGAKREDNVFSLIKEEFIIYWLQYPI